MRLTTSFWTTIVAGLLLLGPGLPTLALSAEVPKSDPTPGKLWVYFGTYTAGDSKGIYLGQLDLSSGKLDSVTLAAELANPAFLAVHPRRPLLYAVGELSNFGGKKAGAVSALAIQKNGKLQLLNQQVSGGSGPCHLCVDRTGRNVLVANYGSGTIACLPIHDDGRLAEASCIVQHAGSGPHPQRQRGPHAHAIYTDAANRFALTADLGLDKILVYRLDAAQGKLTSNRPGWIATSPGAGPRHLAFHPASPLIYAINELNCTIVGYRYDAEHGVLTPIDRAKTLPEDFQGANTTAEIQVHPSGKFVYGSNRGHNSIAMYAVDTVSGKLTALGHQYTEGKTPRNFQIDPTGQYLLAANQDSHNVVVFRIDATSGRLQPTGQSVSVPSPVCIEMMRPLE